VVNAKLGAMLLRLGGGPHGEPPDNWAFVLEPASPGLRLALEAEDSLEAASGGFWGRHCARRRCVDHGRAALVYLQGLERHSGDYGIGMQSMLRVDRAWPTDSLVWRVPSIHRMIRQALTADAGASRPDTLLSIRFTGEFGKLLEES
jgi:hypothetical protein